MPPPTRAKRAIDEAPSENPERMLSTRFMLVSEVRDSGYILVYRMKSRPRPPSASPTTDSPMTEPPVKATVRASLSPWRAAEAGREVGRGGLLIPKSPPPPQHI